MYLENKLAKREYNISSLNKVEKCFLYYVIECTNKTALNSCYISLCNNYWKPILGLNFTKDFTFVNGPHYFQNRNDFVDAKNNYIHVHVDEKYTCLFLQSVKLTLHSLCIF